MTDVLLTSLMCAPRSVYSWDIVVTKVGGKLFFDKRYGLPYAESSAGPKLSMNRMPGA